MIAIQQEDAQGYNDRGYGIFRTVNDFNGKRKTEFLTRINAWFVEIDGGKDLQRLRIKTSPIYPSRIVESKNGYHLYFNAIDATLHNYAIIEEGLIHHFAGDGQVKDVARVLREPGFLHWKDKDNPFMVREILKVDVRYREKDMFYFFPKPKKDEPKEAKRPDYEEQGKASSLTSFLDTLDNKAALERLSGTSWVNGEQYSFKSVSRGRFNIVVSGKSTNCFIDERRRIGAVPGGPTVWQWLKYFGHSDKEIYEILKEIYPGVL